MSDSLTDSNWLVRHRWWILLAVGAVGGLITQFHHVEPNVKRIAELTSAPFKSPLPAPASAPPAPTAEPPKKVEPQRPTVACLKSSAEMRVQLKALPGEKWEPAFNAHFKNRTTCMALALTEVVDGRLKFAVEDEINWAYLVTPRNRGDLKKFKTGTWLLIDGDLERYVDTGPGVPDEIHIARARLTEVKDPDGLVTGSIKR